MSGNLDVVERFIGAINENDMDGIMAFFAEDAEFLNIAGRPSNHYGKDDIRTVLTSFHSQSPEVGWRIVNIAETADGVVLTERVDRFRLGEGWLELPVMGAFELADGRIVSWRDYFDRELFEMKMQAIGADWREPER
jgi:limonene-1,2-epoxide hydrolase